MKANGMIVIPKLRKPRRLLALGIRILLYIGCAAIGSTAPNTLRQQLVADIAIRTVISHHSVGKTRIVHSPLAAKIS